MQLSLYSPSYDAELCLKENPRFGDLVDPSRPVKDVREPYSSNISAGKNSYVYDAHTYHTKVPPQGIKLLIDYYTRPGDVVLDPFCGSGMTGVAVTELDRVALLSDLSPAAAFIAYNHNTPVEAGRYMAAVEQVLAKAAELQGRLYTTECRTCSKHVPVLYTVWSYGLLCDGCSNEFILWDVARDEKPSVRDSKIKKEFECPHCGIWLKKRSLKRTQRYPVQVGYKCCQKGLKESSAELNDFDRELLASIDREGIPDEFWYPKNEFFVGYNTRQPIAAGITSIDKCYTPRALYAMAFLWKAAQEWPEQDIREKLLFTITSLYRRVTVFSEFRFWGGSGNTANFNVPAIMNEQNVFATFKRKANTISWYFGEAYQKDRALRVSTQSATNLHQLPDRSVDYIFTDPPFGANINYSEMNFLWESWLKVFTDNSNEAIVNTYQSKGYPEYTDLLTAAFREMHRVLKDDAWLTVVFHNSSEKAWKAIQTSIVGAGFTIQGTQTFDKEHGTYKMFVSENAVGIDLVLHCQKTNGRESLALNSAGDATEEAKTFIRAALATGTYVTKYLHVAREDEFDYRKLYADWLADALPKKLVTLDFEDFRTIADSILAEGK